MFNIKNIFVVFISFLCVFTLGLSYEVNHDDDRKDYIIYMGSVSSDKYSVQSEEHLSILQKVVQDKPAEETLIRSYGRSFSGFAARLTEKEFQNLKGMNEVVSVFPSRTLELQTTRSWDFLRLPQPNSKQQRAASDIIIGVLDTGVWLESPSFYDEGLSPIPKKWKGGCHGGLDFICNKKIIGARGYLGTARDDDGHGSHTASTAAGRIVEDVDFFGIAKGTARGGVPTARIAVYKVCDQNGCKEANILAAFDDAIADGVDLITVSVGGSPTVFDKDAVAIGAFHAMERGVLTMQSAGNDGDSSGTIGSVAPWLFTVAASTTDRRIIDNVVLGNGKTLIGNSVNTFTLEGSNFPLLYGKGVTSDCDEASAKSCEEACLDQRRVKGKIIVCDSISPFKAALRTGALGVLAPSNYDNLSFITPLPGATFNEAEFAELKSYLNSTKAPTANILKSVAITDSTAPAVAPFSSRGPNTIASDILKPDISAPGVNILAAFSPKAPISEFPEDPRSTTYNVLSGTSMACPHVASAAAYVKSVHPHWSPSAIKSALMTTAVPISPSKNVDEEFAYGSGNLNPTKATHPGLIYEANKTDYITFLCKSGYDNAKLSIITGIKGVKCPTLNGQSPKDVNYPSMQALVDPDQPFTLTFKRSVTNVGRSKSAYTAKVKDGSGIKITVKPNVLNFKALKEVMSFEVTVHGQGVPPASIVSGSIIWNDGTYSVRSPIVVYTTGGIEE
ncbi:hypothetical protein vseg_013117 [Gypsophila vaccaria]